MSEGNENVALATRGQEFVDSANQEFYSKFPYPWPPTSFPKLDDPEFETVMLNQSLGDFDQRTVPITSDIWVAGCGTNQAVYTALRFPRATITGSDLSPASIGLCGETAEALGIRNLTLRQESLNHVAYEAMFDYIICTGVIHHNADPAIPLTNLSRALRPNGVLELMVYNRFHRSFHVGFQKAVKIVAHYAGVGADYQQELDIAKAIAASAPMASSTHMTSFGAMHDAYLADALIQPVEYSYTVESLDSLARACGLELILPCRNQFDMVGNRFWSLKFSTKELQGIADAMPDVARWQLTNLLLLEQSPMVWFFLRHRKGTGTERYEAHVNADFLNRRFVRAATSLCNYVRRSSDLHYKRAAVSVAYPSKPQDDLLGRILARADGTTTMRQVLLELGVDIKSQKVVGDIRTQMTTSLSPYLKAV